MRAQGSNTRPWGSPTSFYGTVILNYFADVFSFKCYSTENCFWNLTTGMERMEEYVEEEPWFTEPENLPRDPIPEDLTTNSSKLLQTVNDLKFEMESVKWENERILRPQEELNQILTERFQIEGRGRRIESEDTSHQHIKRLNKLKMKAAHLQRCLVNNEISILLVIVVMIIITLKRVNTNLMRKFMGNSKR